ncbi:MAG: hypothetical protein JSS20_12715 [Proteobacteria bacterium]|nr:hypothetical protein [Pseudomonadota bacterium]
MKDAGQTMQTLLLELIGDADQAGIPRSVSAKNILMAGIGSMIGAYGVDTTRRFVDEALAKLDSAGTA